MREEAFDDTPLTAELQQSMPSSSPQSQQKQLSQHEQPLSQSQRTISRATTAPYGRTIVPAFKPVTTQRVSTATSTTFEQSETVHRPFQRIKQQNRTPLLPEKAYGHNATDYSEQQDRHNTTAYSAQPDRQHTKAYAAQPGRHNTTRYSGHSDRHNTTAPTTHTTRGDDCTPPIILTERAPRSEYQHRDYHERLKNAGLVVSPCPLSAARISNFDCDSNHDLCSTPRHSTRQQLLSEHHPATPTYSNLSVADDSRRQELYSQVSYGNYSNNDIASATTMIENLAFYYRELQQRRLAKLHWKRGTDKIARKTVSQLLNSNAIHHLPQNRTIWQSRESQSTKVLHKKTELAPSDSNPQKQNDASMSGTDTSIQEMAIPSWVASACILPQQVPITVVTSSGLMLVPNSRKLLPPRSSEGKCGASQPVKAQQQGQKQRHEHQPQEQHPQRMHRAQPSNSRHSVVTRAKTEEVKIHSTQQPDQSYAEQLDVTQTHGNIIRARSGAVSAYSTGVQSTRGSQAPTAKAYQHQRVELHRQPTRQESSGASYRPSYQSHHDHPPIQVLHPRHYQNSCELEDEANSFSSDPISTVSTFRRPGKSLLPDFAKFFPDWRSRRQSVQRRTKSSWKGCRC